MKRLIPARLFEITLRINELKRQLGDWWGSKEVCTQDQLDLDYLLRWINDNALKENQL